MAMEAWVSLHFSSTNLSRWNGRLRNGRLRHGYVRLTSLFKALLDAIVSFSLHFIELVLPVIIKALLEEKFTHGGHRAILLKSKTPWDFEPYRFEEFLVPSGEDTLESGRLLALEHRLDGRLIVSMTWHCVRLKKFLKPHLHRGRPSTFAVASAWVRSFCVAPAPTQT